MEISGFMSEFLLDAKRQSIIRAPSWHWLNVRHHRDTETEQRINALLGDSNSLHPPPRNSCQKERFACSLVCISVALRVEKKPIIASYWVINYVKQVFDKCIRVLCSAVRDVGKTFNNVLHRQSANASCPVNQSVNQNETSGFRAIAIYQQTARMRTVCSVVLFHR